MTPGLTVGNISSPDGYVASLALAPPIRLTPNNPAFKYVCAPKVFSVPYSAYNVGAAVTPYPAGNNRVTIQFGVGAAQDFIAPSGLYGYVDIQSWLNQVALQQGWVASSATQALFTLSGLATTQQLVVTINPSPLTGGVFPAGGLSLSFVNPSPVSGNNDSMGPLLGFPAAGGGAVLSAVAASSSPFIFTGPNAANLAFVSAYLLYCSVASGAYSNGAPSQVLAVFNLGDQMPNTVFSVSASAAGGPVPLSNPGTISSINFWLTDQLGNAIPLSQLNGPLGIYFTIELAH
jgi:hypothetical protein